jgi:hypothetical protein
MTVRRMKTYTGGQGYVYQYYFVGQRPGVRQRRGAAGNDKVIEYVFDVTADRKTMFSVSVLVQEDVLANWAAEHGRRLTEAEQYGAAKMRLFQGFDDIENMQRDGRTLLLDSGGLREVLTTLGVE